MFCVRLQSDFLLCCSFPLAFLGRFLPSCPFFTSWWIFCFPRNQRALFGLQPNSRPFFGPFSVCGITLLTPWRLGLFIFRSPDTCWAFVRSLVSRLVPKCSPPVFAHLLLGRSLVPSPFKRLVPFPPSLVKYGLFYMDSSSPHGPLNQNFSLLFG